MEVAVVVVAFIIYFLPALNASSRKHPSSGAIWLLNLFLGWTLLGWVVALVWSAMRGGETAPAAPPASSVADDSRACPVCAETIKRAAIKCRYCGADFKPA